MEAGEMDQGMSGRKVELEFGNLDIMHSAALGYGNVHECAASCRRAKARWNIEYGQKVKWLRRSPAFPYLFAVQTAETIPQYH